MYTGYYLWVNLSIYFGSHSSFRCLTQIKGTGLKNLKRKIRTRPLSFLNMDCIALCKCHLNYEILWTWSSERWMLLFQWWNDSFAVLYLDDIVLSSRSPAEHVEGFRHVLTLLSKAAVALKLIFVTSSRNLCIAWALSSARGVLNLRRIQRMPSRYWNLHELLPSCNYLWNCAANFADSYQILL